MRKFPQNISYDFLKFSFLEKITGDSKKQVRSSHGKLAISVQVIEVLLYFEIYKFCIFKGDSWFQIRYLQFFNHPVV